MEQNAGSLSTTSIAIAAINLRKTVHDASGDLTILHELNFTVPTGQTLAIVGASGSGKSTLLSLLAGLDLPSSGSVQIDGADIYALDEDGRAAMRKAKLGFVFQGFRYFLVSTFLVGN